MSQGDMYQVSSDMYGGKAEWQRRPAECTRYFNFGDRMIGVHITKFWCSDGIKDPFLAIYSTCSRRRDPSTLLVSVPIIFQYLAYNRLVLVLHISAFIPTFSKIYWVSPL